jgi:phage shock protein A
MEPEDARAYVLAFIQTLKEVLNRRESMAEELKRWQERIRLAESAGRMDLADAARRKEAEYREDLAGLDAEKEDLEAKVAVLKDNLRRLEGQFRFTVDTEQLLAELNMLVGEETKAETDLLQKFKDEQVSAELEELKKKLDEET